ncbi:MAG TPA: DUF1800 domain-containing protein [Mucilaginibacter sp.]|jgi:uncharacterized protein (DUF1800 family)|nr:DUF1800 domain-containing protein [Mucilaginibacter sp.]
MSNIKQVKHLFARAGFGMRFEETKAYENVAVKHAVKNLLNNTAAIEPLNTVQQLTDYSAVTKGDVLAKKMLLQQQRQEEKDMNIAWMNKMIYADAVLREKMTLFWHNHFACRTNNAFFAQQLNNIHRTNALGNFRTMLFEVAESPAMLQFLNNQQNQKNHPNENFAREVMELFTIGRGNYTEADVKESARAFTGYGFNKNGEFLVRKLLHDDGQKTFLGKTGNFTGEDIMNMLCEKKETAHFISNKLYKYLVNEIPDPDHVKAMAEVFYKADYEIKPLLEYVFTADWFYSDKNTGNLVKSPVEFLVGLSRQFYITYDRPEMLMQFQRALGQVLFYPPNVAGWPGGRNWIDSSSLMYRLKIPSTLLNGGLIDFTGKADPEDEAYLATVRNQQQFVNTRVQAIADWDKFLSVVPKNISNAEIAQFLLEPKLNNIILNKVNGMTDTKAMAIELVSTPEYQLC